MRRRRRAGISARWIKRQLLQIGIMLVLVIGLGWLISTPEEVLEGRAIALDGDTVLLDNRKVRLTGIDAPEGRQICEGAEGTYACGQQAARHLRALISWQTVTCIIGDRDRYGRLLGICSVSGAELNAKMVLDGWAVSYGGYHRQESEARKARRGIWQGEFEEPEEYRRRTRRDDHENRPLGERGWLQDLVKRLWP